MLALSLCQQATVGSNLVACMLLATAEYAFRPFSQPHISQFGDPTGIKA